MKDLLPDAEFRIKTEIVEFFQNMADIARSIGHHAEAAEQRERLSQTYSMEISSSTRAKQKGLIVQLIHSEKSKGYINVEVRSQFWSSENDLTYEEYSDSLKLVVCNLLSVYNKKHGSRYRLKVQSKEACEHKLPQRAEQEFKLFLRSALSHPYQNLEWKHFYKLARICHSRHLSTNGEDIFRLSVHRGLPESNAISYASLFEHLCKFQRLR
jgi:hypothetical protein